MGFKVMLDGWHFTPQQVNVLCQLINRAMNRNDYNNWEIKIVLLKLNVSGYVCNHGSPNGERDTASPRGRYGERPQRDSCLKIHM